MKNYTVFIGTNNIDEYYEMDTPPRMGDKVLCQPVSTELGGMLGNAAAIHAGYGTKTYMIDSLDESADSKKVIDGLLQAHVDTSYFTRDPSMPVVKCLIMVYQGERMIFVLPNHKESVHLSDKQISLIQNAGFIFSSLTELQALENYREVLRFDADGPLIAIDVEQGTLRNRLADWEILRKSRLLFINDGGNDKLIRLYGDAYMDELTADGTIVIRTLGSAGCAVYAREISPIKVPGHRVNVVDTTGAGDTFNSSFLFGYMQGWDLQRCAEFANAAAARATTIFGPRGGIAQEETIWNFLKERKEK